MHCSEKLGQLRTLCISFALRWWFLELFSWKSFGMNILAFASKAVHWLIVSSARFRVDMLTVVFRELEDLKALCNHLPGFNWISLLDSTVIPSIVNKTLAFRVFLGSIVPSSHIWADEFIARSKNEFRLWFQSKADVGLLPSKVMDLPQIIYYRWHLLRGLFKKLLI